MEDAAKLAIKSHDHPEHILDRQVREMKAKEHTGIELTEAGLAYLRKIAFDKVESVENSISMLESSLHEGTAINVQNAEEELKNLKKELGFLQRNLIEKLFNQ